MLDVSEPKPGRIGAIVRLSGKAPHLEAPIAEQIKQLVYEHKLVVMRPLSFSTREYVEFARNFGTPQVYFQPNYHHPEHPEIFVSANVPYNGNKFGVAGTGRYWHTDYQFFEQPLPLTMLYPQQFTRSSRQTSYIDVERVLSGLPPSLEAKVRERRAQHDPKLRYKVQAEDIDKSVAEILEAISRVAPPVWHPSVIEHPVTHRRGLYISPGFTVGLEGLGLEDAQETLNALFEFITRPDHVHTHTWEDGDILLWDNRTLLHRASDNKEGLPSVSFRIGIYDGLPFYEGLPAWSEGHHEHHSNR